MAQSALFRTGAAYYPDYIPPQSRIWDGAPLTVSRSDRMKIDFERMRRSGLSWIRMAEFSWSTVEPLRGVFSPDVFLEALDLALEFGLDVIFCTPTTAPPPWLTAELPEILPADRNGRVMPPGTRRHYDPTNAAYCVESERITEYYARTFGSHEAVQMWQTDNEFGCHGSTYPFTPSARRCFQDWLKNRYADIDVLNEAWQTAFWSQRYGAFSEIPLPMNSYADPNPGLELDFRRAMNCAWRSFQKRQVEIIQTHSTGRPITHNFMTLFFELDPWLLSQDLDIAGFDHYQMESEVHPVSSAWQFRLMASLKQKPFMVLEQQPVQVNWQKVNRRFSLNWLFLWGMQSMFAGANSMLYFSWQRMYGGAEQYHDGIVGHDIRMNPSEQEELLEFQTRFLAELAARGIAEIEPVSDVTIVLDFESAWTHEIASQSELFTVQNAVDFAADLCLTAGLGFSFVSGILQADAGARMWILPSHAFEFSSEESAHLQSYVEKGGVVLTLPRTLMKRRDNRMSELPLNVFSPGDLRMRSYGALAASERESFRAGRHKFRGHLWAEHLLLTGSISVAAAFDGGMYSGAPAVMRQCKGSGSWVHLAVLPEQNPAFYRWLLALTGVAARVHPEGGIQVFPLSSGGKIILGVVNPGDDVLLVIDEERAQFSGCYPGRFREKSSRKKHRLKGGSAGILF